MLSYVPASISHPVLKRYLRHFAQVKGTEGPVEKILPPRPGAVLVITLEGDWSIGDRRIRGGEAVLLPLREIPLRMRNFGERVDRFMVAFEPYGLSRFIPMDESVPIAARDPREGISEYLAARVGFDRLSMELRGLDVPGRVEAAEAFMLAKYREGDRRDGYVADLADALAESVGGEEPVGSILRRFPLGVRQLERLFLRKVGISPRGFLRLCRFGRAEARILAAGENAERLGDIGADSGYYDQAHFIREFERNAELNPGAYSFCAMPKMSPPYNS